MIQALKAEKKVGFVPFLVVGDPDLATSERAVSALIEEGADLIELGVPFSDAMADGPVIQAASEKAARSVSLEAVLGFAARMEAKHAGFPFVLFTYFNPVHRMGLEKFALKASEARVHAVLVVDLPPEEAREYCRIMERFGVKTVFLASPTTSPARIRLINQVSSAFIYYVSRTGVTGVQSQLSASLESELGHVRKLTDRPIAVGFGIASGEQARQVAQWADAVVVGSAFVKIISEADDAEAAMTRVRELAREIRTAIGSRR